MITNDLGGSRTRLSVTAPGATCVDDAGDWGGGVRQVCSASDASHWKAGGEELRRMIPHNHQPVAQRPLPYKSWFDGFVKLASSNLLHVPIGDGLLRASNVPISPATSVGWSSGGVEETTDGGSIAHAVLAQTTRLGTFLQQFDPLRIPGADAADLPYRGTGVFQSETHAGTTRAHHGSLLTQINHDVETMLKQHGVLEQSQAGKISSRQLVVAAIGFAQQDDQSRLALVRQLQSTKGHYGGRDDEVLSEAYQRSLFKHWVAHNVFGSSIERFLEHRLLEHETEVTGQPFNGLTVRLHLSNRLSHLHQHDPQGQAQGWIWSNVVLRELPVLRYVDTVHEALMPQDPEWGQINAGLLYAQSIGLDFQDISAGEALALGQLLFARLKQEKQAASPESIHYFRVPALLSFAATHASLMRGRGDKADLALESRALDDYQARHDAFLAENFAPAEFEAALSQRKTRYGLAEQIIRDRCPGMDVSTYLNLSGTFCRHTPHVRVEQEPNYLEDIDQLYRKHVDDIGEKFLAVDKLLVLAAMGNMDVAEIEFIGAAEVVRANAEFSKTHQLTYAGQAGANPHARAGLTVAFPRSVEFFSAFQGSVERIYALCQDDQRIYKLVRVDRDVARYHSLLADQRPVQDAEFRLRVRAWGMPLKQREEPQGRLIEQISQQHRRDFAQQLYDQGYAKTTLQKVSDFAWSLLPFYTCVTAAQAGKVEEAAWACSMDTIALLPVLGSLSNISAKFGQALATGGMRVMCNAITEVALGNSLRQIAKSGARGVVREVVIPASQTLGKAELSELTLAAMRAIDPFFETAGTLSKLSARRIVRLGSHLREYLPPLKRLLPKMRTVTERLPETLIHRHYGTLAGLEGQIPLVRLEGQLYREQAIYVKACPDTGAPFGPKYVLSDAGELSPIPIDAARRLINIWTQGLGGKGGPKKAKKWARQKGAVARPSQSLVSASAAGRDAQVEHLGRAVQELDLVQAGSSRQNAQEVALASGGRGLESQRLNYKAVQIYINSLGHTYFLGKIKKSGDAQPFRYDLDRNVFLNPEPIGKVPVQTPFFYHESEAWLKQLSEHDMQLRVVTDVQRMNVLKALGFTVRLPSLPSSLVKKIPRKITCIWIGDRQIGADNLSTLKANVDLVKAKDDTYPFRIFLSAEARRVNQAALSSEVSGIEIIDLESADFYDEFRLSKNFKQYQDAMGAAGDVTNFASAADILRLAMLKKEGGLYLDVDDVLTEAFDIGRLATRSDDSLLLSSPFPDNLKEETTQEFSNSFMGTQPNNPTIDKMLDKMYARYKKNPRFYTSRPSQYDHEQMGLYASELFHLTGPKLLTDVVTKQVPELRDAMDTWRALAKYPVNKEAYFRRIFTLSGMHRIGDTNSWVTHR